MIWCPLHFVAGLKTDRPARFTVNFNAPSLNPQWSVRHCKGAAGLVTVWCNSCHLLRPMVEKTKLTKIEQSVEFFLIHLTKKKFKKTKINLNLPNGFLLDNLLASDNKALLLQSLDSHVGIPTMVRRGHSCVHIPLGAACNLARCPTNARENATSHFMSLRGGKKA